MSNNSSSFELLHETVQKWVWNQGWTSLRDIQENSIPVVLSGVSDVIISASTAGGKGKQQQYTQQSCQKSFHTNPPKTGYP